MDRSSAQQTVPRPGSQNQQPRLRIADGVKLLRIHQWTKNALLFAGLIFAGRLRQPGAVLIPELLRVVVAFAVFCCVASATYVVNDVADLERDRAHPEKRLRPLASGRVPLRTAGLLAGGLALLGLLGAWLVSVWAGSAAFLLAVASYLALTLSYSFFFKRFVIVDVLFVAFGFVLRVAAGCLAIPVVISPWLALCTLLVALFIALCKRRHELLQLGDNASAVRQVLPKYSAELLDEMISTAAALTIMSYSLYTFTAKHTRFLGRESPWLMTTIPFVIYGVFRYLYLVHRTDVGGTPETMFKDVPLALNLIVWAVIVLVLTLRTAL